MERELRVVFPPAEANGNPVVVEPDGASGLPGGILFIGAPQRHRISSAEPRPIL